MEFYLAELPISNDALGLIIAAIIFLVTITLIAKKLINFVVTIILLFFAIASGMAIAHNDLVREYFRKEKVHHEHEENFLEQFRDEAVNLLNRIVETIRSQPPSSASKVKQEEAPAPAQAPGTATENANQRSEDYNNTRSDNTRADNYRSDNTRADNYRADNYRAPVSQR